MNGQPKKTSPWVWVGVGCLGFVVLSVGGVIAVGMFGYHKAKQFEAELKDPQARAAKVRSILGASQLPPGYHAVVGMSVPFVMDMAMLSDEEPDFQHPERRRGGLGQRGFLYIRTLSAGGNDKQQLRDYFEGRSDDADVLRRNNIRLDRRGEVLRRGVLDMREDMKLMYVAQRGELEMSSARSHGISTVMLLDCPGDGKQRFGIWFGPDPAAAGKGGASAEAPADTDLTGTPADEAAIREFMDHFRVCGS
jgi:hypothetical protein